MKMITILFLGLIVGILLVGSGCCERDDDVQNVTTQDKSKIDDSKIPQREIVDRTYTTDTYDNGDGSFTKTMYSGTVNIWWWDEFIPVEEYLNPVVKGDSLIFNDPNGNKIIEFGMNYEKESVLSLASPKIEVNSFRGGWYFETDADTEVKSMEYELSSDIADFEYVDDKLMVNKISIDFGMAKREQNITTTFDKDNSKLIFEIEDGKTGSLKMIDPVVSYNSTEESSFKIGERDNTLFAYPPDDQLDGGNTLSDVSTDSSFDTNDNNYQTLALSPLNYGGYWVSNASVEESIDSITQIKWTANLKCTDADLDVYSYIWDGNGNEWDACGATGQSPTTETTYTCTKTTSISDYFEGSSSYFLTMGDNNNNAGDDFLIDVVNLEITYKPESHINITYPTTSIPKTVAPEDDLTIYFNVTSGDDLVTSGVEPHNITIGTSEAELKTHTGIADVFKVRADNDLGGSSSLNFIFGDLDDVNFAALGTGHKETDTVFSVAWSGKDALHFNDMDWTIKDDTGSTETADIDTMVIPYGDYILNATSHLECGHCGAAGSGCQVTFTTAFPDTNYAILCNPAQDSDAPVCQSLNSGTQKTTTGMEVDVLDDTDYAEYVSDTDWCVISYGVWNFTRSDGDEVMIQAGIQPVTWGDDQIDFYQNMPNTDYVVVATHEDDDTTDPAACDISDKQLTDFELTCEDDGGGTGGSSEYVYWLAVSLDGDANLTRNVTVDDFGLAPDGHNWTANVTVPNTCSGSSDLMVNVSYSGSYISSLETGAVICAAADTCTCPGDSSAHEFDCSDECDVATCTAGDVTFTGSGFTRCGGVWAIEDLGDPGSGCTLWIDNDCDMETT